MTLHRVLSITTMACLLSACGGSSDSPSSGEEGSTGTDSSGTASSTATASGSASASGGGTATDSASSGGTGEESGSSSESGTGGGGGMGDACTDDADCESGQCWSNPISGGVCSECNEDADCMENGEPGTCSGDITAGYATCTPGGLGDMCEPESMGCQEDLLCSEFFMGFGYCSTCNTDEECTGDDLCSPVYQTDALAGYRDCVAPGSVPSGQGCPLDGDDMGIDTVCEDGLYCTTASLFGMLTLGVCGECRIDDDCGDNRRCVDAEIALDGVTAAYCEDLGGTDGGTSDGSSTSAGEETGGTTG